MITKLAISVLLIALSVSGQYNNCPNGYSPYTVKSGDTFSLIASRYGTSIEAITAANPGVDSRYLQIGQTICVPFNGYNTGYYPTTGYYPVYTTTGYPSTYQTNYPTYPSGYNTNYNTNSAYPSNTYYGVNQN
ncbi:peptidoglycan-binding, partial [Brachionus plicatilis]